jgi:3-oxoacyl-[acyl-carrier protein] reductase
MKLQGRIALVTGGSRGIGRASALALAAAGSNVAVNYLRARDEAESLIPEVAKLGARAIAVQADVSREADVQRIVQTVEQDLGRIDILVNNAGISVSKPPAELTLDDWNHTITTNLTSSFLVSQAVVPGMRQRQWGRLIFLSSIAAQTGGVIGPHYAASKAGILGLMHSYASLLANEGITANAIAPALIDTDMIRNDSRLQQALLHAGRLGTVDEVADVVLLLATNSYITGQTINVNGGRYMS